MKVLLCVLILLILFILLIIIFYNDIVMYLTNISNYVRNKEKFLTENIDPDKDGKMIFGYLTNPNYANSILSRYYINDDKKILGIRTVQHPYQIAHSPNNRDIYFGTLFYDKTRSDNIYYSTGVRL